MRLRRLRIDRLPGIGGGFEIDDPDAGLNVVLGPNASGKSSLCRAIRALLYNEPVEGAVALEADFEDTQGVVRVVRQGRDVVWTRDGRAVDPPALPDQRMVSCFTIHVEQLLSAGSTERRIGERVGRILAGGYDLEAIRRAEPFSTRPRHGHNEDRALQAAERVLTVTNEKQRQLRNEEQDLEQLRDRKQRAARAARRVEALKTAIRLLQARRTVAAIERERAKLPDGMERLSGDELERLESLQRTLAGRTERADALDREIRQADAELEASGLESSGLAATSLAERQRALDALRTLEQERRTTRDALGRANDRLADTVRELGGREPALDRPIDPVTLHRVETELHRRRELTAERRAIEEQLGLLEPTEPDDGALERARTARGELSRWLAAPEPDRSKRPANLLWILLLAAVALGGVATLALRLHWAFGLLALLVLAFCVPLMRPRRLPRDRREEAGRRFVETGVAEPDAWDEAAVTRRLDEMEAEIAAGEHARLDARNQSALERKRDDVRAREDEVQDGLRELAGEVGYDPEALDASFERWLRLVAEYDEARRRVREQTAELSSLSDRLNAARTEISDFLADHDGAASEPEAVADDLAERLRRLEARTRQCDNARIALDKAGASRERALKEIADTNAEIAAIYRRAGLEPGAETELESKLLRLDEWRHLGNEFNENRAIARDTEQRLGDEPALLAHVVADDEASLRRQHEAAQELAEAHGDLASRVSLIEDRVASTRAGHDLEEARARVVGCRETLRERLADERFASAAQFMLEDVQSEHIAASRPAVLRRAEAWFARFTNSNFALVSPSGSNGEFMARETSAAETRTLEQLSSGTRMQLLLALRLAFALEAEQGCEPLPLFLDEALTVADPARFRAVVESLHEFARAEGRQLFYLTAQPHDLREWSEPGPQPKLIRLDEIRRLASAVSTASELELPPIEELPSSEGMTASDYGAAVRVPRISLWDAPQAVHLFHLLRDELPLLEQLLRRGIRSVGQLQDVLRSDAAQSYLTSEQRNRLGWKTAAVSVFLEAGREGRGRPVDRHVLEQAEVSPRFLDRLVSLADDLGGDASALLDAIAAREDDRAKGFRTKQHELLHDYFVEHGHVDRRPVLDSQQIELRISEALTRELKDGTASHETVADLTRALAASALPERPVERL